MKKFKLLIILFSVFQIALATDLKLQFYIKGIQKAPLENVINSVKSLQTSVSKPLTHSSIHKFYLQAPDIIKQALEPYGYFHAKIHSRIIKSPDSTSATFSIVAGPRTYITSVVIKLTGRGKNDLALKKLLRRSTQILAANQYLNTIIYDKIKQNFYTQAEKQGYLKAYFSQHMIQVNKKTNTATIILVFNTGSRYYFGSVYFSKNFLADSFLKNYAPFQYGDPFSSNKLSKFQNNLNSTVYFKHVEVNSDIEKAVNYHIPVVVNLVSEKSHQYSIGLGYGTDTGIRGSLGAEWRYLNTTGNYFQGLLQYSQKQNNTLQLRYIIPGKNPINDSYVVSAGILTNRPGLQGDQYITEQVGFNRIQKIHSWKRTTSLQIQHENFTDNTLNSKSLTVMPGIAWEKIHANNRINTQNGYRIFFNLHSGAVLTNLSGSFFEAELQGKYIHSFDQEKNRIILSTDLGFALVKNFAAMPLSQRFFTGGTQSIRGFSYQALGPGRYLAVGSIEWQHQLCGNFYSAIFYNAGNAVENLPFTFQQAAGVGLLYRSLIGPIEITVAHPFNQQMQFNKQAFVIQFTMGPDL